MWCPQKLRCCNLWCILCVWVCPLHTCRYDPEFEVSLGAVHKLLRSWSVGSTLTWLKSAEIARNASGCLFLCCYGFNFIGIQIFARSCFFLHQLFFLIPFCTHLSTFISFITIRWLNVWGVPLECLLSTAIMKHCSYLLGFFLCAWLSLDDLHCVDLLQLTPWRGHPVDAHVSIINGAFIIRSCTLCCWSWRAASAAENPSVRSVRLESHTGLLHTLGKTPLHISKKLLTH